jgi:hypothetical protein
MYEYNIMLTAVKNSNITCLDGGFTAFKLVNEPNVDSLQLSK